MLDDLLSQTLDLMLDDWWWLINILTLMSV